MQAVFDTQQGRRDLLAGAFETGDGVLLPLARERQVVSGFGTFELVEPAPRGL